MSHISVVTITCRRQPRFEEMGAALAANARRHPEITVDWTIVDEIERDVPQFDGLPVYHVPAPETEHRPHRPAPNAARNVGLQYAPSGLYVVFLDDCSIVSRYWLQSVITCYENDWGFRCNVADIHELVMPEDGLVRWPHETPERPRKVLPTTVAGRCFGAPRSAYEMVGGFDEAYDGALKKGDTDAFIRMARAGLQWYSSRLAWAIQMSATHTRSELGDTSGDNTEHLTNLHAVKTRIMPIKPHGYELEPLAAIPGEAEPDAVVVPAPPAAPSADADVGETRPIVSPVSGDSRGGDDSTEEA